MCSSDLVSGSNIVFGTLPNSRFQNIESRYKLRQMYSRTAVYHIDPAARSIAETWFLGIADYAGGMDKSAVPKRTLFLLGDNRAVSIDSRSESVGFVEQNKLVGKAVFRLFPFGSIGGLYDNYKVE